MRRMDKYKDEMPSIEKRTNKNKDLYQNTNNKYTNITDVTNANVFEINSLKETQIKEKTSREDYQKLKKYQNVEQVPKVKKELDDFKYYYQKNDKKIYDINSVLEEARKNKKEKDDLEEKRKLKHTSYNVFSGVNLEELIKYREEKKKRIETDEEKEIREFVDTIASKTLAGEIDKQTTVNLLSDLMATSMLDKVEASDFTLDEEEKNAEQEETKKEEISKEETKEETIIEKHEEEKIEDNVNPEELKKLEEIPNEEITNETNKKLDTEFYTKSMDLTEEDFEMDNGFVDKKLPLPVKIIIFLLIIGILAVAGYFIYKKII